VYETFTDSSARLGKLFIAIGNTELSNKMLYVTDQKVFIKTFYCFAGSCVAVERQYRQ
jgi:hypothetical protein